MERRPRPVAVYDPFTDGYSASFLASGIAMVIASLLAILLIRGTKEDLMPSWDDEDAAAYAH